MKQLEVVALSRLIVEPLLLPLRFTPKTSVSTMSTEFNCISLINKICSFITFVLLS